jgi:hypothetical protein
MSRHNGAIKLAPEMNRLYHDEKLSINAVAKIFQVSSTTVSRNLTNKRTPAEGYILAVQQRDSIRLNRRKATAGYWLVYTPDHPRAFKSRGWCGYIYEHILVWEQVHQKLLPKDWIIHHVNGIKDDNRPENLLAMPKGKHSKIIPEMALKIRELEAKVKLLEKALDEGQMMFTIGAN